jgi:hypothetical protein
LSPSLRTRTGASTDCGPAWAAPVESAVVCPAAVPADPPPASSPSLATLTGALTSTEPIWPVAVDCPVVCLALGSSAQAGVAASASTIPAPSAEALRII